MAIKVNNKATLEYTEKLLARKDICKGTAIRTKDFEPGADMMQNERNATFYDEVTRKDKITGEEVTGFLFRANFLDRL